jgi:hypothetical protein
MTKIIRKGALVAQSRHFPTIGMEGVTKTVKNSSIGFFPTDI